MITGAMADHADKRDSQSLPAILNQTINNLQEENIEIEQIAADTGYSSGESLQYLEEKNIDAFIPNFGQYKSERKGFFIIKKKINTNVSEAIKQYYHLRVSIQTVKATQKEPIAAASPFVKTVPYEKSAAVK